MTNDKQQKPKKKDLKQRTQDFAYKVIRWVEDFPNTRTGDVIGKQLLRAGTSVGANYRAATRSRSRAEFIAKMRIVEEEADECGYWLELAQRAGVGEMGMSKILQQEASELTAICVASSKTARAKGRVTNGEGRTNR